jgi:N-terminal domain on NACHT_NTPase and P-loop NTPases
MMVLEPITAVGLASNVARLIDFSFKAVNRLDDYCEKHDNVPTLFSNIRVRLPLLIDSLTRTGNGISQGIISQGADDALIAVVDGCLTQIKKTQPNT